MSIGWHGANFGGAKKLKNLSEYLKALAPPEERRAQGARGVRAMFERHKAKKGPSDGDQ